MESGLLVVGTRSYQNLRDYVLKQAVDDNGGHCSCLRVDTRSGYQALAMKKKHVSMSP